MNTTDTRRKRSEKLSPEEFKQFEKWVAAQDTKLDAAAAMERTVVTLDAVLLKKGKGSPDTIAKVRTLITPTA